MKNLMKKLVLVLGSISAQFALAQNDLISVTIDSLTNVSGNGALEACGKAEHKNSKQPILVTLKHDESFYTTLTAPNSVWCIVFKRWTFNGKIDVSAKEFSLSTDVSFNQSRIVTKEF
jgi:hypothetical protein